MNDPFEYGRGINRERDRKKRACERCELRRLCTYIWHRYACQGGFGWWRAWLCRACEPREGRRLSDTLFSKRFVREPRNSDAPAGELLLGDNLLVAPGAYDLSQFRVAPRLLYAHDPLHRAVDAAMFHVVAAPDWFEAMFFPFGLDRDWWELLPSEQGVRFV